MSSIPDFTEVLKAFLIVLDRLGPSTWENESDEYPQVAFNTIKDNTSYSELLQVLPVDRGYWAIQWMEAYVKSIGNLPVFSSVMPLIIQYLCEELQHERYKDARNAAISVASKVHHSRKVTSLLANEEYSSCTAYYSTQELKTTSIRRASRPYGKVSTSTRISLCLLPSGELTATTPGVKPAMQLAS